MRPVAGPGTSVGAVILVDAPHAGALLVELRESGRTVPELPDGLRPADWTEAYAIQDELHRQGGWDVGALKVGCTGEFAQQMLGIDEPIGGIVPADRVHASGVRLGRADFHHVPHLECEFALRVGVDIEDASTLADLDVVRGLVDAVAPAIELVETRFDNPLGASGPSTVADNSAASRLVLGDPASPVPDLVSATAVLSAAGAELASGTGAAVLGDPYRSLQWSLGHEVSRGRSVPAGTWVITGTCTGLTPCPFDVDVAATFAGIGDVTLRLES